MSADLAARHMHLLDVLAGLVDVGREALHSIVEAHEVLRQLAQGVLDDVDLYQLRKSSSFIEPYHVVVWNKLVAGSGKI